MIRVIAEIGVNHCGREDLAERMVLDAAAGGAWGVKFQFYVPELLDARKEKQAELRKWVLPVKALRRLRSMAGKLGLAFGASAFDDPSVELLNSLNPDFQKVACGQKWPTMKQLNCMQIRSYTRGETASRLGVSDVSLLCVPRYPASIADYLPIPKWADGISDHTGLMCGAALARGLDYAEVHVWTVRECPDRNVSIPSLGIKEYVRIANLPTEDYPPAKRTRVVLKRPIKGQKVAWLRGVDG